MKTKKISAAIIVFIATILTLQLGRSQPKPSSGNFGVDLMTGNVDAVSQYLRQNPKAINQDPRDRFPPLTEAAQYGNFQIVELFVTNKADINAHGVWGYAALHFAASRGDARMVDFLLKHHADVNAQDENGMTPICLAVRNPEVIKLLLANGADVNAGGANSALSQAVEDTRYVGTNTVQLLLANGAKINGEIERVVLFGKPDVLALLMPYYRNSTNLADQEILHGILGEAMDQSRTEAALAILSTSIQFETNLLNKMVAAGDASAVRSVLATNPDSLNTRDYLGWTPLHIAALTGQSDMAEVLLSNRAMPDVQDDVGNTPLHWAAFLGHSDVVKVLLDHRANMDISGSSGKSPLTFSLLHDFPLIAVMLITNGANPNLSWTEGPTPLEVVTGSEDIDMMKLLLAHGASVSGCIEIAAQGNSPEAVRLLIANGADLQTQMQTHTGHGQTLFHLWAGGKGNTNIADELFKAGCDMDATNGDGQTPLHLAVGKWNFTFKRNPALTNSNARWPSDFIYEDSGKESTLWLLDHKADVNAKDKNGQTPLHLIITRGNLKEIQCLLDHNADVNAKDKNGKTPLALFEDLKIQEEGFSHGWLMWVDVKAVEGLLMKYGAQGPALETKPYSAPSAGTI